MRKVAERALNGRQNPYHQHSQLNRSCDLYKILQEKADAHYKINIPLSVLDTVNANMIPTFFLHLCMKQLVEVQLVYDTANIKS